LFLWATAVTGCCCLTVVTPRLVPSEFLNPAKRGDQSTFIPLMVQYRLSAPEIFREPEKATLQFRCEIGELPLLVI
jgi:hypothetical protein